MAKYSVFQLCKKNGVPYWGSLPNVIAKDDAQAKALVAAMKPKGVVEISKVVETIGTNKDENAVDYQELKTISARSATNTSYYTTAKKPLVCDNSLKEDDVNAVLGATNCFEFQATEKPMYVSCQVGGGNSRKVVQSATTTTP